MSLAKKTYETATGDSLFAANGVKSIPADGYVLASTVTGKLKRGLPLKQGATASELLPVSAAADQVVGILADDTDADLSKGIVAYEEGEFNRYAINEALEASGISLTYSDLEVKARMKGIYFKDVVKTVA